jgi:hypothetical protein
VPAPPEPDPFAPRPRSARLDSALRRPFRSDDLRAGPPPLRPAGEVSESEEPAAPAARFEPGPRRPFRPDDLRAAAPAPKPASEPPAPAAASEESGPAPATEPESAEPARADAKPKSLYDSLEQEMASLLNRPTPKP